MYIAACCCYGTLIKAKLPYGIRFPAGTVWMKLLARMVPPRLAWPFRTTGPMCWGRQAVNRPGCLLRAALHIIHRCAKVAWPHRLLTQFPISHTACPIGTAAGTADPEALLLLVFEHWWQELDSAEPCSGAGPRRHGAPAAGARQEEEGRCGRWGWNGMIYVCLPARLSRRSTHVT